MSLNPAAPPPGTPGARMAQKIADLERRVGQLERQLQGSATGRVPLVDVLPASAPEGAVVMLAATHVLWKGDGTAWTLV